MWALVDQETGALIARDLAEEPTPGAGQEVYRQPRAAHFDWSPVVRGWVRTDLPAVRAERWERVRAARDRAEAWGCSTPLGRVDTDPDSQRKVVGADRMAEKLGAAFSIEWTMQDNSRVTHDAAAMSTMAMAVGLHVAACHAVAGAKRAAIDAAGDRVAIEAVSIEEGWPDAP